MTVNIATGANAVKVTTDGNIQTAFPGIVSQAGYGLPLTTNGAKAGFRSSIQGRLRMGTDIALWHDTFGSISIFNSVYATNTSTMTITPGNGTNGGSGLIFDAGSSITAAAFANLRTFKTFRQIGSSALQVDFRIQFNQPPSLNFVADWGLGFTASTAKPSDGIYFRASTHGLEGVVNFRGAETCVSLLTPPGQLVYTHYSILVNNERAEFYVNGTLEGFIQLSPRARLSAADGLPLMFDCYNLASAPVSAIQVILSEVSVSKIDQRNGLSWGAIRSCNGDNILSYASGNFAGNSTQSADYTNSTTAPGLTLSNTLGGNSGLGGQWQFQNPVAGGELDGMTISWMPGGFGNGNPISLRNGNRQLVLTGVRISAYNTGAAVATTPTLLQWSLQAGGNRISLATTDDGTAGLKGSRIINLGTQSFAIGAAVGSGSDDIVVKFASPLVIDTACWIHLVLKVPIGTATASQIIRGTVLFSGYYE